MEYYAGLCGDNTPVYLTAPDELARELIGMKKKGSGAKQSSTESSKKGKSSKKEKGRENM
jgi:hypothetical protein